jgi:hypothetical protein
MGLTDRTIILRGDSKSALPRAKKHGRVKGDKARRAAPAFAQVAARARLDWDDLHLHGEHNVWGDAMSYPDKSGSGATAGDALDSLWLAHVPLIDLSASPDVMELIELCRPCDPFMDETELFAVWTATSDHRLSRQ